MTKKDKPAEKPIGMVQLNWLSLSLRPRLIARYSEEKPRVCPNCKSPNWDAPKLFKRKVKGRFDTYGGSRLLIANYVQAEGSSVYPKWLPNILVCMFA